MNILQPGEIVTEILLPSASPGMRSSYRKVRERLAWDIHFDGFGEKIRREVTMRRAQFVRQIRG